MNFTDSQMPITNATTYFTVVFAEVEEAAAFIAALARYVSSPAGADEPNHSDRPEVWASGGESGQAITVYLNGAALTATTRGFGSPPISDRIPAHNVIATGARLLLSADTAACGRDDVMRRLAMRSS